MSGLKNLSFLPRSSGRATKPSLWEAVTKLMRMINRNAIVTVSIWISQSTSKSLSYVTLMSVKNKPRKEQSSRKRTGI